MKTDTGGSYEKKTVDKIKIWLKSKKKNQTLMETEGSFTVAGVTNSP
jgi:hypothetical protein